MATKDGAVLIKMNINTPQTIDVNISKDQPSRVSGLGGVALRRSKSLGILYKYYTEDSRKGALGPTKKMLKIAPVYGLI